MSNKTYIVDNKASIEFTSEYSTDKVYEPGLSPVIPQPQVSITESKPVDVVNSVVKVPSVAPNGIVKVSHISIKSCDKLIALGYTVVFV